VAYWIYAFSDVMTKLKELYKASEDCTGGQYCGLLTLEWDYENWTCDISMPG
jgi:hypothetical protein